MAKAGVFPGPLLTGTCTLGMGVRLRGDVGRFRSEGEVEQDGLSGRASGDGDVGEEEEGRRVVVRDAVVELAGDGV